MWGHEGPPVTALESCTVESQETLKVSARMGQNRHRRAGHKHRYVTSSPSLYELGASAVTWAEEQPETGPSRVPLMVVVSPPGLDTLAAPPC